MGLVLETVSMFPPGWNMPIGIGFAIFGCLVLGVIVLLVRWNDRNRRRLQELAVAQQEAEAQAMQDRDNNLYLEEQAALQAWQRGEAAGMALTWTKYYPTDQEADWDSLRMYLLGYDWQDAGWEYHPVTYTDGVQEWQEWESYGRRLSYRWTGKVRSEPTPQRQNDEVDV